MLLKITLILIMIKPFTDVFFYLGPANALVFGQRQRPNNGLHSAAPPSLFHVSSYCRPLFNLFLQNFTNFSPSPISFRFFFFFLLLLMAWDFQPMASDPGLSTCGLIIFFFTCPGLEHATTKFQIILLG